MLLIVSCSAAADTLLVVNRQDATLAFVDPTSREVVAKIAVGEEPHEVAVSGDGSIAVVCDYGGASTPGTSLAVVDVLARRELRRFVLPGIFRPHGIQGVGSRFYFTAEGSRAIARYDARADRIDFVSGTGQEITHMLVVSRDERKIFAANISSNSVSVMDLSKAPRQVGLKQIAASRGVEGIDLAPDESVVWVAGVATPKEQARITVIDPVTDAVVRTIPTTMKLPNRVKFSRDGTRVVISDSIMNEVVVFDAATGIATNKVSTAAGPAGLLFSPDGKWLFVACSDAGKVQVVDTAAWAIVGEIVTGAAPDGMAYVRH
jgi:YVTN family beta-propeller protein